MSEEPQKLFLLEFLVENVSICKTKSLIGRLSDDRTWLDGQTCVTFQFLAFPFLEVCEKDFTPCKSSDDSAEFLSGKSCMFALSPELLTQCQTDFPISVAVNRRMPAGVLPDTLLVGETEIPVQEAFTELVSRSCGCEDGEAVSKSIQDTYPIHASGCCKQVGDITVFIRLSCFGKVIVTQFQMNSEKKSYLFKANEDEAVYQCKKMEVAEKDCGCTGLVDPDEVARESRPQSGPPMYPPPGMMPYGMQGYGMQGMQGYGMPGMGGMGGYGPPPCGPGGMGEGAAAGDDVEDKNYEEIGAELNGHALKIRVPKKKKCKKEGMEPLLEGGYMACPGNPPGPCGVQQIFPSMGGYGCMPQKLPKSSCCGNNAPCDQKGADQGYGGGGGMYGMQGMGYGGMGGYGGGGYGMGGGGGYGMGGGGGGPPCGSPCGGRPLGSVGVDGKDITFSMPSGPAPCAQKNIPSLRYKMSSADQPGCGRVIKVEPERPGKGGEVTGQTQAELTDPESRDVFVLRIGKQTDGPDKRARLELELKTPKREDPNACQNTTSHDTQYLASDFDAGGGKGGKKGGKGGKGGKKGKKGKK